MEKRIFEETKVFDYEILEVKSINEQELTLKHFEGQDIHKDFKYDCYFAF